MYSEDELLPINLLQHWRFCQRQCGLLALDNIWQDNVLTTSGMLFHEVVHRPDEECDDGLHIVRGMRIASFRYGITGICDVVEIDDDSGNRNILPIEYKVGAPKRDRSDDVQLCAQALCLEEMMDCTIRHGAFFYGKTRRRLLIELDDALRAETLETIAAVRAMLQSGQLPPARYEPKCLSCSLLDLCQPKAQNTKRLERYMHELYNPPSEGK